MDSNVRTINSLTLHLDIWKACQDGDLDQVRIIIREGQDINEQSQDQQNTPLHIAAANAHYLIVKYLAEVNANPIIVNKKGQTPLQLFNDKFNESHPLATLSRPTRLGSAKGAPAGH